MDVVILLVFISLCLVAASLFFFVHRLRAGDFDHGERLALAPLEDDPQTSTQNGTTKGPPADAEEPEIEDPSTAEAVLVKDMSLDHSEGGRSHARC